MLHEDVAKTSGFPPFHQELSKELSTRFRPDLQHGRSASACLEVCPDQSYPSSFPSSTWGVRVLEEADLQSLQCGTSSDDFIVCIKVSGLMSVSMRGSVAVWKGR